MKQHIDTIPVWDAYKADCECPLCHIRQLNEAMYVDSFLGASVMEPDTRVEVNRHGFCNLHFQMMYAAGNRLGLALITHTYMKQAIARLAAVQPGGEPDKPKKSLFAYKKSTESAPVAQPAAEARQIAGSCLICDRLNGTMQRYFDTILYMWEHEAEFRNVFAASKGLCISHYGMVLERAPHMLSGRKLDEFVSELHRVQMENLSRVEKDLEWFTLKFDYRNQDKPWGASQDAVERAILKLRGPVV